MKATVPADRLLTPLSPALYPLFSLLPSLKMSISFLPEGTSRYGERGEGDGTHLFGRRGA